MHGFFPSRRKSTGTFSGGSAYVYVPAESLPKDYPRLLSEIKKRISAARSRAVLSVNEEMIALYWDLGRWVLERQKRDGWGTAVIERVSHDIQEEFPGIKGFSRPNIQRMRSFYRAWTTNARIRSQAASELPHPILRGPAAGSDSDDVPRLLTRIPWHHNVVLIENLGTAAERLWYARQTIEHGWSRSTLMRQIEIGSYSSQGQAQTNFALTLSTRQARLAQETLKDEYALDFLPKDAKQEKDIERGIIENAQCFLMELGKGFAFIGRQVRLEANGREHVVDLLLYNTLLHSHVVVELKAGPFQPEHVSKLSSYLAAADAVLRHDADQPSIGVILCRSKNRIVVEFALRDQRRPIGVACYRLTRQLPGRLKKALPTAREFEAGLRPPRTRRRRRAPPGLPHL